MSELSRKCARESCNAWAIKGGTVCNKHGSSVGKVKANAAIRYELTKWGLTDEHVDPGEQLLKLVSQSARRAQMYADELQKLVEESPELRDALIGETFIPSDHGSYKAGEYI